MNEYFVHSNLACQRRLCHFRSIRVSFFMSLLQQRFDHLDVIRRKTGYWVNYRLNNLLLLQGFDHFLNFLFCISVALSLALYLKRELMRSRNISRSFKLVGIRHSHLVVQPTDSILYIRSGFSQERFCLDWRGGCIHWPSEYVRVEKYWELDL